MSKPVAVIAGDIHYDLSTLEFADKGTRMAITMANELNVPFIANGDTHNTKANLRGECINAMIDTFKLAKIKPYVNIGNHCKIHSASEEHSLNFLAPYASVIDTAVYVSDIDSWIIPYYSNISKLRELLSSIKSNSRLIMHQGLNSANMGDYTRDPSALDPIDLARFRTILSHYHARQDIQCGPSKANNIGLASFIGSLYTVSFGESADLPKGFQILYEDGSLEFVPTNLRKHIIFDMSTKDIHGGTVLIYNPEDLLWLKITGPKESIAKLDRQTILTKLNINAAIDLIPDETFNITGNGGKVADITLQDLITEANIPAVQKERLKIILKEKS